MGPNPVTVAKRSRRWTIVELGVALAILVAVGVAAGFSVRNLGDKATTQVCRTDAQTIIAGVETYLAQPTHHATDDPTMAQLGADGDLAAGSSSYRTIHYHDHVAHLAASGGCPAT